jgi:hypothetical protein
LIDGVQVNVHQVDENILKNVEAQAVQVQVVGILYAVWYSQVCVVLSFILEHHWNIER